MGRILLQVLLMLLPWSLRRRGLVRFFGYSIHPTARIGWSLVFCDRVEMAENSGIGKFTVIRGLAELRLAEHARLGNFNWCTAVPKGNPRFFLHQPDRHPALIIKRHGAITSRHMIDCTNTITVGAFTIVGGWHSQLMTHSVDLAMARQDSGPVTIGDYCFVGSRSILLKNSVLPDYSVLGPGSTLTRAFEESGQLYSGVPAVKVREMDRSMAFFTRETGYIP